MKRNRWDQHTSCDSWRYHTCCINALGDDINAMVDEAAEITYATLRRRIGGALVDTFAADMKYDTGSERGGLRLKDDWHVTYHKSFYRAQPCFYIQHSGIEYIFLPEASE